MRVYECQNCNRLYVGDEMWHRDCPRCGCSGNEANRYRFYECQNCRRVYVGDEMWHRDCPSCGMSGREI